jgi:acetyl-CoA carboxylase carboxyl transferase subunit beta
MRIRPTERFAYTFDGGRWQAIALPRTPDDPLGFDYGKQSYRATLAAARKATGQNDAMAAASGEIGGVPAVVLVQDFAFMAGSLGTAAGEAFITAAEEAVRLEAPFVVFTASGGARMQEGALSLMQMARTTVAIQRVRKSRLPYVVVLTDIQLAEPGATVGFTGRRVIEDTIRETLPPDFQTAEFVAEHGMVDRVVNRKDLPAVLASIFRTLMMGRSRPAAA